MPVDMLNNIGYLDVQFGGLDFGGADIADLANADVAADYQQKREPQSTSLSSACGLNNDNLSAAACNQRAQNVLPSNAPIVW